MEHFRSTKGKIGKQQLGRVTIEQLDTELRRLLVLENRLHPALFSSEAQHKVSILYLIINDTASMNFVCKGEVPCIAFLSRGNRVFFPTHSQVLQHMMDGLILYTFKHEDLQCLYFRYTARELLASAVMRPVLNLASPR